MRKFIFIILFIFGAIFLVGMVANYFLTKQMAKIGKLTPPENTPQLQFPEQFLKPGELTKPEKFSEIFENFLKSRKIEKKEFISSDGKLKLSYTSEWIEADPENLSGVISTAGLEKYDLKTIFFAQNFGLKKISLLIIQEMIVPKEKTQEEILKEMKESNKEKGSEIEFVEIETKGEETIFEAKYKNKYNTHSKEKMIFLKPEGENKKIFLIGYLTFERDWLDLKDEANEIIEAAQLIE